jgi:hypothetical protein
MSAIGSVVFTLSLPDLPLPARLDDAGQLSDQSEVPEADAAQPEFTNECAWSTADVATVTVLHGKLCRA